MAKKRAKKKKPSKRAGSKKKAVKKKVVRRKRSAARKKTVKKKAAKRKTVKKKAAKKKKKTARKKTARKPAKKKTARKAAPKARRPAPKAPKKTAEPGETPVGTVIHYYSHLAVAVVRMDSGNLAVGDTIHIKGHTTDFRQRVESMEIEHARIPRAVIGQEFGLKVIDHAREHDLVYKAG